MLIAAASPSAVIRRRLPGGVGVQRKEELPVRKPPGQPVRGVHREGGLADPGHPVDRTDLHWPLPAATSASSRASSGSRPVSCQYHAAGSAPPQPLLPGPPRRSWPPAPPPPAPAPRAAATNSTRTWPVRLNASASSRAVSLRAMRLIPRRLSPAASASSSCVSRASAPELPQQPGEPQRLRHRFHRPLTRLPRPGRSGWSADVRR
jgi:hypothetical protein